MAARRVVYSCLFGGYETLLDQPVAAESELPFVLFTDDASLTSDTWQVRHVEAAFPADQNRSSRRPKILAHEYLADFDESLYIDNSVLLTRPPEELFDALLPDDVPFAVAAHSYRGPVHDEFAAVVRAGKDVDIVCAEQHAHYAQVAPEVLDHQTLWGGLLLRRHHDDDVRAAMQLWWEHVLRYSRRDQLSLPFALWRTGLPHAVLELDNRRSDHHLWPRDGTARDPAGGAPADLAAGLRADAAAARALAAAARADSASARAEATRVRADAAELRCQRDAALAAARASDGRASTARRRADVAETRLAAVRRSLSWRVTRPLRAVSGPVRRASAARRSGGPGPR